MRHHCMMKDLDLTDAQKAKMMELRKNPEQLQMRHKRAKAGMERMKQNLDLSPGQLSQIEQLNKEFRQQADVIRANEKLAAAQQQQQLKSLRAAHRENIQSILTPEQREKLRQGIEKKQGKPHI